MAFCKNCGTQLDDQAKFCSACGTPTETPAKEPEKEIDIADKLAKLNDTPDTTDQFDKDDVENNKVMAVLAYLSWLVLIPLLAAPNSKFARYHCNQGIVLWLVGIVCSLIAFIPVIGWILAPIIGLATTILSVLGIINAITGKAKEIPFVGQYKILK